MALLIEWTKKSPPKEKDILDYYKKEGLKPKKWTSEHSFEYEVHNHKYNKILFCMKGSIVFRTHPDGRTYELKPGDQLILPAGTIHSAVVGQEGVTCFEAPEHRSRAKPKQ